MSCNLREKTISALRNDAIGKISKAKVNIEIYLHNPVGIGEHSDVLGAIQDQIDLIAKEEERLEAVSYTHLTLPTICSV